MQRTSYDQTPWDVVEATGTREKILHEVHDEGLGKVRMTIRHYDSARDVKVHRHRIEQIRYVLHGDSGPIVGQPCPPGTIIYVGSSAFYGNYHREGDVDYLSLKLGTDEAPVPFPKLRIPSPIQFNPENFVWQEQDDGTHLREIASLTERGTRIAMVAVSSGSTSELNSERTSLHFVASGTGIVDGEPLSIYDSFVLDAGESIEVKSETGLELLRVGLPLAA